MHSGFDPCNSVWEPVKEHPLGLGPGVSQCTTALSISRNGVIAVAESNSRQIHMFNSEYHLLKSFKVFETTPVVDDVPAIQALTFDHHGNLYVCGIQMQDHSGLHCFNANGKKIAEWYIDPDLVAFGRDDAMVILTGVGVDSKQDVYFSVITVFINHGDHPEFVIAASFLCVCHHGTSHGKVVVRYAEIATAMTIGPNGIIYSSNETGVFSVDPASCVVQKVGGEDAQWKEEQNLSTISMSGDGYIFLCQSQVPGGLQIFSMEGKEIGRIPYKDMHMAGVVTTVDPWGFLHVLPVYFEAEDMDRDNTVRVY